MHTLEEREGYWRIMCLGQEVCKVEQSQGTGPMLGMFWANLNRVDPVRASDFLFGFAQGAMHVSIICNLQPYVAGQINDPPSEDYRGPRTTACEVFNCPECIFQYCPTEAICRVSGCQHKAAK